jgi:hypothetical protein
MLKCCSAVNRPFLAHRGAKKAVFEENLKKYLYIVEKTPSGIFANKD